MKRNQKFVLVLLVVLFQGGLLTSVCWGQKDLFTIDDYFKVKSMRVSGMTKDGQWLICSFSTSSDRLARDNYRYADPTYVAPSLSEMKLMNTTTGEQLDLYEGKRQISGFTMSEDEMQVAYFEVKGDEYHLMVRHREDEAAREIDVSEHGEIASNSHLIWADNGQKLFFALREDGWKEESKEMFETAANGPVIIHDTDEPFLKWDAMKNRDQLKVPVMYDREAERLTKLLPELKLQSIRVTKNGQYMIFERNLTEKTSYERGGRKRQMEVLEIGRSSEPRVLFGVDDSVRPTWREDNMLFVYTKDGDVFVQGIDEEEGRNLTEGAKEPAEPVREIRETKDKEDDKKRFSISRFSKDGQSLLSTSRRELDEEDRPDEETKSVTEYWVIDLESGDREMIWEQPGDLAKDARVSLVQWSNDEKSMYFSYAATNKYDRGLMMLDVESGELKDLVRSDHIYGGWRFSDDGQVVMFSDADGDRPADWYITDADFDRVRRLTTLNPWLEEKALSHTELIKYRDTDGVELYGVLYYPANYEKGKKYPLITEVYENYFNNGFSSTLNILTSAGYAVLHPSVDLETGYPGEAWAKGALSAINKVIDMGIADPENLGIQGTSYGGYATVLLITQTDRFKAAINNSGKVNMVSFYTQSPRYGTRNITAPEYSQDRIGGSMWEYPERYLAHSAILYADRIKTPLLCITGDQDPNVEAKQSEEIYFALRRLEKKCVWLRYHNGAHGGPHNNDERRDMYERMVDWYDTYLKDKN
ncbi:MAG: S9 family peptidase [Planctomycetes bacterium]|nr:S9 family peptidase [Planctomycetota bacterium]